MCPAIVQPRLAGRPALGVRPVGRSVRDMVTLSIAF